MTGPAMASPKDNTAMEMEILALTSDLLWKGRLNRRAAGRSPTYATTWRGAFLLRGAGGETRTPRAATCRPALLGPGAGAAPDRLYPPPDGAESPLPVM